MLTEITKMTTQLFISKLGFIFLFSRNIKGLIDFLETFWLQSERALSEVRSSIQSCGFCEEYEKKAEMCVRREQTVALLSSLLQGSTILYVFPAA